MTARALAALVVLTVGGVALTTTLAACDAPATDRLTKAELVRRANERCAAANHRIARLDGPDPLDATATEAHLGRVIHVQRGALRELRTLVAPEADERDYRRWLAQVELALAQSDASRRAIATSDVPAATAANRRGEQLRAAADRFAAGYGLRACAVA